MKKDEEGGTGHANNETSFAQSRKKKYCYCCGKEGHLSPDCPKKDEIPRNESAIRKPSKHMQVEQGKKDDDSSSKHDKISTSLTLGSSYKIRVNARSNAQICFLS